MSELPSGTVTFLFTDIEGSTRLERQLRERYGDALADHQTIVRQAFAAHGGHEVDTQGDSFFYVFPRAKAAVDAAVEAQRALAAHRWPEDGEIRVRMGLSTGEASLEAGRYVGFAVHRAARISAAGHGGQILLSSSTRDVVEADLGAGLAIRDLGERRFKDLPRPERVYQLVVDDLPSKFAPLKTLDVDLTRKRRRLYAGAALIGVLAAAVAIPVFALGRSGGAGASVAPNSVAIIDPDSNAVVDSAPVGVEPDAIAVGEGAVWVANTADQTVSRLDPQTRRVVQTIPVGEYPSDVAVAAGSAWVALGALIQVRRIDVASNQAEEVIPALPQPDISLPALCQRSLTRLAAGGGALWFTCVLGPGTSDATRIDLRTKTAVRVDDALVSSSPVGIELVDVVFGLGSAWLVNRAGNAVAQIAADSLAMVGEIQVGRSPEAAAFGLGSIWVANGVDDTVSRLEVGALTQPDTLAAIPAGDGPADVAVGEGAVWVVDRAAATVSRIDAGTGVVVATIPFDNQPIRVAAGGGAVWVTVQDRE
jgi:YVTN family beta-propeller protein